jgi:hypothetical protein
MRVWLTAACALAVVSVSDAYTAANGVPGAAAGAGSGTISGYAISDVHYELAGAAVSSVSFSLDPPEARTARVRVRAAGAWFPCTIAAGLATCALGAVELTELERLTVVAAG